MSKPSFDQTYTIKVWVNDDGEIGVEVTGLQADDEVTRQHCAFALSTAADAVCWDQTKMQGRLVS